MRRSTNGFSLVEILMSVAVLTLLMVSVARLVNEAATLTNGASRRSETEKQSRRLLDRIAIDLSRMLRRSDVDYYMKTPANPQPGNDQIAFYSEVPGYYPSSGSQSPVSLVAYRINAQKHAERLGKGLLWNGVSPANPPVVFLPKTIMSTWPGATNMAADIDYEIAATNVFRFEYYYWLTNGLLSEVPWNSATEHSAVDGTRDLAGICIAIAAMDSRNRLLFSDTQLSLLAAQMDDFSGSMGQGALITQWQNILDTNENMPRRAISGIRICQRCFGLARIP